MSMVTHKTLDGYRSDAGLSVIRDEAYFLEHQQELTDKFGGKYVAIRGESVVGAASTLRELHEILYGQYDGDTYAFVREVCPASFEQQEDPTHIVL